jgi:F0F1-type ATP synthase alpha subunit
MKKNIYRMSDEEFAEFSKRYPNVPRNEINEIEELLTQKMYSDMALRAQISEIELLKNKALVAMGTEQEMRFSDIETGMLKASLSDGRQALKEIMEKTPVEAPSGSDGVKMKNQGRKKKHHDDSRGY